MVYTFTEIGASLTILASALPTYFIEENLNMRILKLNSREHHPLSCTIPILRINIHINGHAGVKTIKMLEWLKESETKALAGTWEDIIEHTNT